MCKILQGMSIEIQNDHGLIPGLCPWAATGSGVSQATIELA